MNVPLTKELEQLVNGKVKTGLYSTANEVIREGLRLLEERDRLYALRLKELRTEVKKGLESGPAQVLDVAAMKTRLRAVVSKKRKNGR
jgi:antitoxin ParD1/3/4